MALEDFERELAQEKSRETQEHRHRKRDDNDERRHKHRHHHRSQRHRDDSEDRERRHRHKRHRDQDDDGERRHRKRRRSAEEDAPPKKKVDEDVKVFDSEPEDDEDEWVEKEAAAAPPEEDILDQRDQALNAKKVHRDTWMTDPAALDVEYVQSRKPKAPPSQFVGAKGDHEFKVHESEVNRHLKDLEKDFEESDHDETAATEAVKDEPAQHEVSYTFGDSGSSWRMTKLRAVYRKAEESKRTVDEVASETYGDLRSFDDAREEERELDRRKMYGNDFVGLEKPSGEFFQERKMKAGLRRESSPHNDDRQDVMNMKQGESMEEAGSAARTAPLDTTGLNKLKAQLMKARLRNDPKAAQLEQEYKLAEEASLANAKQSDVVVLNNMEQRQLAGGREGEVKAITNKRGRGRGLVEENEDMSIEDMVKQERRSKVGSGREFADRIAKDSRFKDDLDYMDDNASNLSKKVMKSDSNLRNAAVGDFQKMQKALSSCPLCHHEDTEPPTPPVAPVVSLATRTYLTLPTEPEVAKGGAVIVPLQHRLILLECDDDEWEEMRNFMKSLTRFYDSQDKGVIFYENAAFSASKRGHAALNAVPLPRHLAETAPAYFKEAILASDEQWTQHKPIIDTLTLSQKPGGPGKAAFRKSMPRELPYFHVFFGLDGGYGHVVEDERRWPKGDLFAREIFGGMLDRGPEVIKRQGRWERGDRRVEGFRKKWGPFDWTKVLMDA